MKKAKIKYFVYNSNENKKYPLKTDTKDYIFHAYANNDGDYIYMHLDEKDRFFDVPYGLPPITNFGLSRSGNSSRINIPRRLNPETLQTAIGEDGHGAFAGIVFRLVFIRERFDEVGQLGKPVGFRVEIRHDALDISPCGGDVDPAVRV